MPDYAKIQPPLARQEYDRKNVPQAHGDTHGGGNGAHGAPAPAHGDEKKAEKSEKKAPAHGALEAFKALGGLS
jgi:hypothetical protein